MVFFSMLCEKNISIFASYFCAFLILYVLLGLRVSHIAFLTYTYNSTLCASSLQSVSKVCFVLSFYISLSYFLPILMSVKSLQHNFTFVGDESKPLLLLIHGFGTSQSVWEFMQDDLLQHFRLAMYDHAGATEQSSAVFSSDRHSTMEGFVQDLLALCDENGISGVPVLGHSMGGTTALLAGLQRSDLFTHLLLLSPSSCFTNYPEQGYVGGFNPEDLKQLFGVMEQDFYAWAAGFAPIAMGNDSRPELGRYFAATFKEWRADIALKTARVIFSIDLRDDIKHVQIPTLILQTEHDIAVPMSASEYLQSNIKHSTLRIVPTDGHLPHVSAPKEVMQYIREFLPLQTISSN
jgi:sigma-B regulation protein RsbQ